jgi:predicted transcriptional regulator
LTDSQKYALTIVRDSGMIDNSLYRQNSDCDTLRESRELKKLCDLGFVTMQNRGAATFYAPSPKLEESYLKNPKVPSKPSESTKLSPKVPSKLSESTKLNGNDFHLGGKFEGFSDELKERISSLEKRPDRDVLLNLIEAICREATMSVKELAILLERDPKSLYRDYISVLLQENRLFQVNPSGKTAPNQAYTSRKE